MREVYLVSNENKSKAEELLKKDEAVNRGSIAIRTCGALEIKEDGYFIILDASDAALKIADKLLKGLATKYKNAKIVLEKYDEQEDAAISGFGNILG
jgi:hypothetical protein